MPRGDAISTAAAKTPIGPALAADFPTVTRTVQVNASFVVTNPEHDQKVRDIIDSALAALHREATTFQHKHEIVR